MITIPIEKATGEIVGDVDIVSRGFVYMKESGELMGEAKEVIRAVLRDHRATSDSRFLRHHVTDELEKFFFASTRRRPLILPVMVEI
jgi:ribonuclease J